MIDDSDDDNMNEFDNNDLTDDNFDNFDQDGRSLRETLRDQPLFKVGIIVSVIILVVIIFLFFRREDPAVQSYVPQASDVTSVPGTEQVSENIREAIQESDEQRREEAEATGQSALPTLLEPPVGRIQLSQDEGEEEDPLQRWRRLQQERIEQETERANLLQPDALQDESISPEAIQAMADAMAAQMQAILDGRDAFSVQSVSITPIEYLNDLQDDEGIDVADASANAAEIEEILLPAGTIEYAQLVIEANSDVPGPVLARIASGPLRGSNALGAFNKQNEYLTLTFNTVVVDGISRDINAIALDPQTTLPGMATDVDRRYFTRIVLPAAVAFIEGTAEAIARSDQTTITVTGTSTTTTNDTTSLDTRNQVSSGVEEAAEQVGEILENQADNTQVLVKIRAGTPIGLLFLTPVLKSE